MKLKLRKHPNNRLWWLFCKCQYRLARVVWKFCSIAYSLFKFYLFVFFLHCNFSIGQKDCMVEKNNKYGNHSDEVGFVFLLCNYHYVIPLTFFSLHSEYRKVASSIPVYYSILSHFLGATNWDVLLTKTCYYSLVYCHVQQSIKS